MDSTTPNRFHDRSSPLAKLASIASQPYTKRYISRIPTEIITHIFTFLLPGSQVSKDLWFLRPRETYDDLLVASRVCREWRRICLSATSLWSFIWIGDDDISPHRADIFSHRSGNSPLEVTIRNDEAVKQALASRFSIPLEGPEKIFTGPLVDPLLHLKRLFPHGPTRIKTLKINSTFVENEQLDISEWFENPAPILESLAIRVDSGGLRDEDGDESYFESPHPIFDGCTPALRKLSLDNVEIPWDSAIFKNLTLLRICHHPESLAIGVIGKVTLDRLLEILVDCPSLVSLELQNAGPISGGDGKLQNSSRVDLPYLRNISVETMEDMTVVKSFLGSLHTSVLQNFDIEMVALPLGNISNLFPQTLKFDPRLALCNYIVLDFTPWNERLVVELSHVERLNTCLRRKLGLKTEALHWAVDKTKFDVKINFDNGAYRDEAFVVYGDQPAFIQLILSFLRQFCVHPENLLALYIRASDAALVDWPFRDIFEILNNVRCVQVWDDCEAISAAGFMSFLDDEVERASTQEDAVACPRLEKLVFGNIDFEESSFQQLHAFLVHRKKRKSKIRYLGLCYCRGIFEDQLSSLKQCVRLLRVVKDEPNSDSNSESTA
ncbi:hypothetical protein SCHPADRAFT_938474 [Schizopora paradoxa]|uniref:F-box domain-containing protein n=1 Tax=Schizopora paradoxa TaxID=27342 RepID=A0A0H2RV88_9AGAM|nr:hypothetical protein SCHPADRAFT_938474 [Schizopora paradoxa]